MTTQTAIFDGLPTGLTLTGKVFDTDTPDTEVTGNSLAITEGTNAKSRYSVVNTRATALPAGDYDIRLFVGSVPIAVGTFTFAGTDEETAVETAVLAELDSATQTQLDNIENTAAQRAFGIVERPPSDTGVITFVWPALGATITGTVSLNNASYIPVIGAFEFLRTDGGKYFYTLAYNTADRPVSAGSARYALTDGTYTRYLVLRVVESGDTGETTALAVLCFDWEAVTGEVPSRSVLNALRHIRNKWALDGNTKTVYAEDDTTPAYTTSVTADGAGNIIADTPD